MALTQGRTDQGVDFGGSGAVVAVGDGIVQQTTRWSGWPGTGGLVYQLTNGRKVYIEEGFTPSVKVGDRVKAGQVLGQALGTSTGIETGYANASGSGPLTPYDGAPDGTPTSSAQSFGKSFDAAILGGTTSQGSPSSPSSPSSTDSSSSSSSGGILGSGIGPNVGPDLNPVDAVNNAVSSLWSSIKDQAAYAGLSAVVVIGGFALLALGLLHATRSQPQGATT